MNQKHLLKRLSMSLLLGAACAGAPALAATPEADVSLAARVSDFGTDLLRQKKVEPAHFKACIALLQAAMKLDPADPRYPRLLVEANLSQRDVDGAIAALKAYRAVAPDDLGAQVELIQLNLGRMETADAKLAYANQILGANNVNPDVRSAVAMTAARLMSERGQQEQANAMVDQAIRLNPLNIEALRMRYEAGMDGMSDFQKTQALIGMIKANPLQPQVVADLANQLANFGLVKSSLDWYFSAIKLFQKTGPVPIDLAIDYAVEQYLADRYDGADGLAIRLLQSEPYNIDALYIRLACAKNTPMPEDDLRVRNFARKTMLGNLTQVRDTVLGVASTQPTIKAPPVAGNEEPQIDPQTGVPMLPAKEADVEFSAAVLPDLKDALAKINFAEESGEKTMLTGAVADMAWYSIYFDNTPDVTAAMLDALSKLVPADNVTLVRLQGWSLLSQNKPDEAKVKLNAIADRDAIAAVGLIKMTDPTDAEANNKGRKLLSENPSKMLGLFLKDSLRDRGIKVVASDKAQIVAEQIEKFPIKWLSIIDKPSDFYLIRGTPAAGQFDYHEPMLVNVTLQNLSEFDITIGPDGVIHNDLWIDATIPVPNLQTFPGTAYDRVTRAIVLRSRQTVTQTVRVDQGQLAKVMNENPTSPQQVWVTVLTNPVSTGQGVGAGPGGYRVQLTKMLARAGFAIGSDTVVEKFLEDVTQAAFGKMSMVDLMATYIRQGRASADDRLVKLTPRFLEKIVALKVDPSTSVRAWSRYVTADLATAPEKVQQVQEMSRSDEWPTRLLAAVGATSLDGEARKNVLTELSNDGEKAIKDYATAMLAAPVSTTQPTTAPATQP